MKIRCLFLLMLISFTSGSFAQKQSTWWYFGENAGLDFSSGHPLAVTNGAMNKDEGCGTLSNQNGQLLLYSNGINVWNQYHQQMPNGFGLMGHESSTQSGLIVPQPGSSNAYIFTTDAFFYSNGLRYSIADMSLLSGAGNVATKNTLLYTPTTEKITAVHHQNQQDIWIITHEAGNNTFRSFLLSSNGLSAGVSSSAGAVHTAGSGGQHAIGQMKASPDGSRLAVANYAAGLLEVLDFNAATGAISNPLTFPNAYPNLYGVEFSPTSQMLYFTSDTLLYQANLMAGSSTGVFSSVQVVGSGDPGPFSAGYLGALQLALDGKIYGTNFFSEYLFTINQPEATGIECGYQEQGVYLAGRHCYAGLPGFVQSWFKPVPGATPETSRTAATPISIYPNPSAEIVHILLHQPADRIDLYNISGTLIQTIPVSGAKQTTIHITHPGVYVVKVKGKGIEEVTQKFLIIKE